MKLTPQQRLQRAVDEFLGNVCLICGRDHPGKILGGKVTRIRCFALTAADRKERGKAWRERRCPCGLVAHKRHRRECSVWRMNQDGHRLLDAAMRGLRP